MAESERQPRPCGRPEHRQFDFWLGEWEVTDPAGELVGHNTISPAVGGCGLREEWRGVRGLRGTSLNAYSEDRAGWHQTWIDSSGTLLLLDGGLRGGAMVLEGEASPARAAEEPRRHRITWSIVDGDPDHVRQHWETSASGSSWETVFDGHYRRAAGAHDGGAG